MQNGLCITNGDVGYMNLILARSALEFPPNSPENALRVGDVLYSDEGILKVRRLINGEIVELFFWRGKCRRNFACAQSVAGIFAFLRLGQGNPIRHLLCGNFVETRGIPHPNGRNTNLVSAYEITSVRLATPVVNAARRLRSKGVARYG